MLNINNHEALLGFSYFSKIGPSKIQRLEKYFNEARLAFTAESISLERAGLKPQLANDFINWRKNFNLTKAQKELEREQINYITWHDPEYPILLKEIHSAPYIIYYRGNLAFISGRDKHRLAIVGSRKYSAYAAKIISELIPELILNKIEIISGLALGIDSLAHEKSLKSGGRTIAVLGSGLNNSSLYPRVNVQLANNIIKHSGLLLSEFPPYTPPLKQNFPQRNRIISGLSQGTVVIEAKEKSGALITARFALEQNREVLAIPGNIFSEFSVGPNKLIKMGAKTITEINDILEIFKIEIKDQNRQIAKDPKKLLSKFNSLNEVERLVYRLLLDAKDRAEKITIDEIIKITKLDTAVINSTLSILELRGIAKSDEIGYDVN